MPPLEAATTYVIDADTIQRLAVAAHRRRRATYWLPALIMWIVAAAMLFSLVNPTGATITLLVLLALWTLRQRHLGSPTARLSAVLAERFPPGETLAVRFGSDAFDIQTGNHSRRRIPYTRLTALRELDDTVMVEWPGQYDIYPRELFTDRVISHIRAVVPGLGGAADTPDAGLRPLPPVASLEAPAAVLTVTPEVWERLNRSTAHKWTRGSVLVASIPPVLYLALLWMIRGTQAAMIGTAVVALLLGAGLLVRGRNRRRHPSTWTYDLPVGSTMEAGFGPEEAEIIFGLQRFRRRYDLGFAVGAEENDGLVRLGSEVYPRELFPDDVVDFILGVDIELAT